VIEALYVRRRSRKKNSRYADKGETMEDMKERLVRYLQDAHAAEVGIAEALKAMVDDSQSYPEANQLFTEHLAVTRNHAARIEQRLGELGDSPSGAKGFFNTMMSKVSDIVHGAHDDYDKVTQDLVKAYATEHLEIGMYTSLAAFAETAGDTETASMALQIMSEEQEAADRIHPLIERCASATAEAAIS
jgi:ferritin-like metal-binding protein YciE